jgi:chemosensory pili system protein ChpB (putative protein-glutamate methylesterase)
MLECWLVDLTDQEKWADLLDLMLDESEVPLIFGDGLAPAKTHEEYPRWERRLFQTLIKSVGRPVIARVALAVPEKPAAMPKAPVTRAAGIQGPGAARRRRRCASGCWVHRPAGRWP